jgi:hypothetical protein
MTCSWCAARAGEAHRSSQRCELEAAARYSGDCTFVSSVPNAGVVPIPMLSSTCESASPIRDPNQSSRMYDAYTHPHQSPPRRCHRHRRLRLEYTAPSSSSYRPRAQEEVANLPIPDVDPHPHFPETLQTRRHLPAQLRVPALTQQPASSPYAGVGARGAQHV